MRIVVISMIRDAWGGSEELWYQMAKQALVQGHEVIHLAYESPETHPKIAELVSAGLKRMLRPGWIPPEATGKRRLFYLGRNYLRKKIKDPVRSVFQLRPDVILYNGTCYSIAGERALLREWKNHPDFPAFFILGQLNQENIRALDDQQAAVVRDAYQRSRQVFFVSHRNLDTARRHLCAEIPNAEVIRNPVNIESVNPLPFPNEKVVRLACVANLVTAHKGQDILIEALSKFGERNWTLDLVGSGYDESYLRHLIRLYGLQDRVFLLGKTTDIRALWADHHALILPSHMEGMPLAVVEAMLCGRVCITTDVGGNAEWIEHGRSGFLAAAPTPALIRHALEEAWDQRTNWPEIGRNAHMRASQLYDPQAGLSLLNRIIAP